ncbi:hypothetical protein [Stagnihabitans tardus]|uniref:Uncharacterized protein n=1 Tax=Stagnihabitans tardus TaxID=2699202 RepID=A0AAE4Y730_9RHOB|nr:hypothetical protein [Stagnihabitans tardus]NBZ86334.1 hypothetical protein [Stagnihabitans tardus]
MAVDPNDPRLKRAILSTTDVSKASLATRILLARLRQEVRDAPASLPGKLQEFSAYFAKHSFAEKDLACF